VIRHPILGSVDPRHVIMTWHTGVRRRFPPAATRREYLTVLPRSMALFTHLAESTATSVEFLEVYLHDLLRETETSPVPAVLEMHWFGNRYLELYVGRRPRSRRDIGEGSWLILSNLGVDEQSGGISLVRSVVETVNRVTRGRGLFFDLGGVADSIGPMVRLER
jgi:hypothetical protein